MADVTVEPSKFNEELIAYVVERQFDLAYLKLTVIIILLIIIIFYITCKFNVKQTGAVSAGPVKVTAAGVPENFTPFPSILKNDIYRSDPAFDPTDAAAFR